AAPVESLALEALHLIELFLELVKGLREIVPLCTPLLRRAEPLEEVLQSLHAAGDAPAREACHGVLEIAARKKLVGHRPEQLFRLERVETLRSVPPGVPQVAERLREPRRIVPRLERRWFLHQALNVERVSPRSLLSLRLRCRPSRTNSTAAAMAAGLPVAPTLATAPFIPGICKACFTYSWLESVGDTCMVAPRWNAARSESNSTREKVRLKTFNT